MNTINVNDLTCISRLEKLTEPMTPEQFVGFLHNLQEQRGGEPDILETLERYHREGGVSAMLKVAFVWRQTSEGQDYWYNVCNQYKEGAPKFLTPLR